MKVLNNTVCPISASVTANCTTGALRLVGGTTANEGRVEICYDNSGAQSVMIYGPTLMPELSAGNLDTQYLVNTHVILYVAFYERLFSVLVIVMVSS